MEGKVKSKKIIYSPNTFVYDIEVSNNHNYYANGILVHNCKDSQTLQGKNLLKLKDYHYKVAMTGTLIMNNPLDSFVPLKWLGIEHATLTNFKQQYCEFGGFGGHQVVGFKNMDILKEEIESNSLRRISSQLKD
jgi:hypothetical protein